MANLRKSWKEIFTENYNGTSDVAKEIEPFIKENYKGNTYIPWATMERVTYMCDENAVFENIKNENGGLVHTDMVVMHQQNIQKGEVVSETESQMFSHMVKVKLTFMEKEFIEEYPIQDQDYSAARVFNQNLVNRALQRAKAKVASRATGIGLKLYEGKDLQFEEVPQESKPQLPVENIQNEQSDVKKSQKPAKSNTKTEKTVEFNIELPYDPMLRHVVFGGMAGWLKNIKYLLPNVKIVDPNTKPDLQLLNNADVVWFQGNAISHSSFYKVINRCRTQKIDFQYFEYASAEKCAEQLALYDMRKVEGDLCA